MCAHVYFVKTKDKVIPEDGASGCLTKYKRVIDNGLHLPQGAEA